MPAKGDYLSKVNTTQMVAVSWSLKVSNDGEATGPKMDVFLTSATTDLFQKTTNDATNDYVNAYRMAIYDGDTLVYLYAKSATALTSWTNGGSLDGNATAITTKASSVTTITSAATSAGHTSESASSQLLIKGLAGKDEKTLKFVVWCEGTDTPDATLTNTGNGVTCNFGLIGLNAQ